MSFIKIVKEIYFMKTITKSFVEACIHLKPNTQDAKKGGLGVSSQPQLYCETLIKN